MTENMFAHTSANLALLILYLIINISSQLSAQHPVLESSSKAQKETGTAILIRVAIFVDSALEHHLKNDLGLLNSTEINKFTQAYMKQVDVILSNLRGQVISRIHIHSVETRLELEEGEFSDNDQEGNVDKLLSSFCLYQMEQRESSKQGWDLGLLLTGKDLYSAEEATTSKALSSSTLGISPVKGILWPDSSCLIVEFGVGYDSKNLVDSNEQRVYPTRGFASTYVAAHELAHSLGLYHDSKPCNSQHFIMSSTSYLSKINTRWSKCSSEALDEMNFLKKFAFKSSTTEVNMNYSIHQLPGQVFDSQKQCLFYSNKLLRESAKSKHSKCNQTLWCSTKAGETVAIGPALEGTECGENGSICLQNTCTHFHQDFDVLN